MYLKLKRESVAIKVIYMAMGIDVAGPREILVYFKRAAIPPTSFPPLDVRTNVILIWAVRQ